MFRTAVTLFLLLSPTWSLLEQGQECGVDSSNFLEATFRGTVAVAGNGCAIADESSCHCAPDFKDQERLSKWKWQCDVQFGPIEGKQCPATVPLDPTPLALSENQLSVNDPVVCDPSIHPTGWPDDPVCGYDNCDTSGTTSVCGCVDRANYGIGEGIQWFCLHSTCACGEEDEGEGDEEEDVVGDVAGGVEPKSGASVASLAASALVALF